MKTLFFTFLAIPLCFTAQTDETKLKQVVGFENQVGIQIGALGFHGYTERSIGRAWTYRVDLGYDMQVQTLEQGGGTGMLSASPATSTELRHYWSAKKESASLFVSMKAGRICQAYLTKSGLRVFGFCPAGSTKAIMYKVGMVK